VLPDPCPSTDARSFEGWGDFIALHMMSREFDNLDGVYSASTYAGAGLDPNVAYFGIRRVPYSVDFTKNALTLKHISDGVALPVGPPTQPGGPNSEVHNAGEVWATMLWEGDVGLHNARAPGQTFEDVRGGHWHLRGAPGYNGTLFTGSGNPLSGRQAFVNGSCMPGSMRRSRGADNPFATALRGSGRHVVRPSTTLDKMDEPIYD
jgi:hypothetical protein